VRWQQEITRDGHTLNHLDKIALGDPKVGARFLFLSPKEVSQSQAGLVLGVVDHSMPNIQVHQGDQPVEKSTLATPGNQPPYHGRNSQADIERQNILIQDIDKKRVIIQQEEVSPKMNYLTTVYPSVIRRSNVTFCIDR